jgi:hypothetical protein
MYVVKESYKQSVNKRTVQKLVYSEIKGRYNHLVGLGGPDLNDYLRLARYAGIKNAVIYEFDIDQLLIQMSKDNKTLPARVLYDDIINCPSGLVDTFYDLDFCCSTHTAKSHISKFKNDPSVFTFSIRPVGLKDSIKQYVRSMYSYTRYDFELIEQSSSFRRYKLFTDDNIQTVFVYADTVPMLVINNF